MKSTLTKSSVTDQNEKQHWIFCARKTETKNACHEKESCTRSRVKQKGGFCALSVFLSTEKVSVLEPGDVKYACSAKILETV